MSDDGMPTKMQPEVCPKEWEAGFYIQHKRVGVTKPPREDKDATRTRRKAERQRRRRGR